MVISSLSIQNFIDRSSTTVLLISLNLSFQTFNLPIFTILICYFVFVKDPMQSLFVVASKNSRELAVKKIISVILFISLICTVNLILGMLFLMILLPSLQGLLMFTRAIFMFIIVSVFYVSMNSALINLTRIYTSDSISTIFPSIMFFYVIPITLVNSIFYQVFDPLIANFSPVVWVLKFLSDSVTYPSFSGYILFIPVISGLLVFVSLNLFSKIEYE